VKKVRKNKQDGKLTMRAFAGTHVLLLGWSMTKQDSRSVLGFAIHRTDHTENEAFWLEGIKVFEETDPGTAKASLREHPVQGFTWSDFTAKPVHEYTYRVVALKGQPSDLREEDSIQIKISTEVEDTGPHEVWFNRGAAASQEYARRFRNKPPDSPDIKEAAHEWLSRGLFEAMLEFIERATDSSFGLRVAAYQFSYPDVLQALKAAKTRGADVRIIHDARDPDVAAANRAAIADAHIQSICKERTAQPSAIAHNKFIVLLKNGVPKTVWTGSTNFTEGGIFGHSNVGHVANNASVAALYRDYWELLLQDPVSADLRPDVSQLTPTPDAGVEPSAGTMALFSPRSGLKLLNWYAERAAAAKTMLCMTFAFGINKVFVPVFEAPFDGLRYALLDNDGNTDEMEQTVLSLRRKTFNRFAIGNLIRTNSFDKWLKERASGLNSHVPFVHTKYMLVDPMGNDPIVIAGSANFSDASTRDNDENMLVIRGDTAVADIYLGEFFRLWNHYAFREFIAANANNPDVQPQFLVPDDSWRNTYFGDTVRSRQRQVFAGVSS
jgi:phosphatidylserine/phosphatidylglycerophosphate/cardiolipin synthase-like enzyme